MTKMPDRSNVSNTKIEIVATLTKNMGPHDHLIVDEANTALYFVAEIELEKKQLVDVGQIFVKEWKIELNVFQQARINNESVKSVKNALDRMFNTMEQLDVVVQRNRGVC